MKIKETVWQVAIRKKEKQDEFYKSNNEFSTIPNPFAKWAADPFIFEKDNKVYIFVELFDVLKWKGDIAYCIYENGVFSAWKIIISANHHFSFPYIFEFDNKIYLMPETGSIKELALYEAIEFPDKWEKIHILCDEGNLADSVFIDDTKMLSYYNDGKKLNLALLIREKDKFVLKDIKHDINYLLRPAGKIFKINNRLIRPVQDCTHFYGEAIDFNELNLITDNILPQEKKIYRLEPSNISFRENIKYKITGVHTYNFSENYEVVDLQYERFNIIDIFKRLQFKIKKFLINN